MKKSIAILTAIIILVAAVVAVSVIIALKQQDAPPVDTSIDTTQTEPEKEEMKFYYTSGDAVAGTLAALPDKNIDSLLEKLGDDCTVVSKELINWNYELCQGYAPKETVQKIINDHMQYSFFSLSTFVNVDNYSGSLPCFKTVLLIDDNTYCVYSTISIKEDLGLWGTMQKVEIDETTYNTIFRITKTNETTNPPQSPNQVTLEDNGEVVFHAPEFKFICEIVKDK